MTNQTRINNKDPLVDDYIASLQQKLQTAGFNIVEQKWFTPLANVWSVIINDRDCPLLTSKGKGTSKKAALASALEDFAASVSTHYFFSDYYLGEEAAKKNKVYFAKEKWFKATLDDAWPDGVLGVTNDSKHSAELRDFYNPDCELNANSLIDIGSARSDRGICCIPFNCVRSGETIHFPLNIINNLYACNGMASDKDIDNARVSALSEIIARYIQFKVIAEGISLAEIPSAVLHRYPEIQKSVQIVKNTGCTLLIQDASLGGEYPVIAATLLNPDNQRVNICFAAHPVFSIALEHSITGLFQGREQLQTDACVDIGFDMDEIASPQNLANHFLRSGGIVSWNFLQDKPDYEFSDWDNKISPHDNLDNKSAFKHLCEKIHTDGNDVFISDYDDLGIYTCKIIVPGLSEVYPVDNLVWENNNAGMHLRKKILKYNKSVNECEHLIHELEELSLEDHYLVSTLLAMPSDAGCIFEDLTIMELITLLALKIQDNERIQEGCEWLLHYKKINSKRLKTYQCIDTLLQLEGMAKYSKALEKLYTLPILNNALALIDGEDVFLLSSEWNTHNSLIEAYNNIIPR